MAGGGGGAEYYDIYGMAKNPNEANSIFLLLRNFDDDKNQLVKFNSSTETKTVLVNFGSYSVWHMRYYNSKIYVLTRDSSEIKIYTRTGSLIESIDLGALQEVINESFSVSSPYKIAVYDGDNILVIFGGTSRGLLAKRSGGLWDAAYFFANSDFNNGGLLSVEVDRAGYFYCSGTSGTTDYIKTYDFSTGLLSTSFEVENYITEMYLD